MIPNIFPCKFCQQFIDQREEIEYLLLSLGTEVYSRFNNILIGVYHIILHVSDNDRLWMLWMSDNLILRDLEKMSDSLVQNKQKY